MGSDSEGRGVEEIRDLRAERREEVVSTDVPDPVLVGGMGDVESVFWFVFDSPLIWGVSCRHKMEGRKSAP